MRDIKAAIIVSWVLVMAFSQAHAQEDHYSFLRGYDHYYRIAYIRGTPDLDGDSYDDMLLHRGGNRWPERDPVVALVSGLDGHLLYYHWGEVDGHSGVGPWGEADVADVDGDGSLEIILGWEEAVPPSGKGLGVVRAKTLDGARTLWSHFDERLAWLGEHVTAIGDIDGDGGSELLVGAGGIEGGPLAEGYIAILRGRDGQLMYEYRGIEGGEILGDVGSEGVGDVDGDGIPDFAIASLRRSPHSAVWVYSGATGGIIWEWHPARDEELLYFPHGPGDLNGDGHADVLLSTDTRTIAYSGADQSVLWEAPHQGDYAIGPFQMTHLDDQDGDGAAEILVSHWTRWMKGLGHIGGVLELSGRTGRVLSITWSDQVDHFGRWPAALGDVNGDGLRDWVAQAYGPPWLIFARNSLRPILAQGTSGPVAELQLVVPSSPRRLYALLFSLTDETGVPLGNRRLPLDDDVLLHWSLAHPVWGILDGRGQASIAIPLPLDSVARTAADLLFGAAVVLDPAAPCGVRAITNSLSLRIRP
ncbi:MAG: FG-GAP-like repeat-containing protein [Planctomycetota bacterium]